MSLVRTSATREPLLTYSGSAHSPMQRWFIRSVELLFGARHVERVYREWQIAVQQFDASIFAEALRLFSVTTDLPDGAVDLIPRSGGLLVVANHPFGVADGLAIGDVLTRVRPDVKLMVNSVLCRPPEARDALLPVDFGKNAEARRSSALTRKLAAEWLDDGHVLVVFPAGGIATAPKPFSRDAADFAWHPFIARLAMRPNVQVLPIFVHGQNSRLFHIVSHFSYSLRVALVFRETLRLQGKSIRMEIGSPISGLSFQSAELVALLREVTFGLGGVTGPLAREEFTFPKRVRV